MGLLYDKADRDGLAWDSEAAVKFLIKYDQDGPWCLTAIEPDQGTETRTFERGEEREMQRWVDHRQNLRNLYFHVNQVKGTLTKKATKGDIARFGALHVDIDCVDANDADEKARILAQLRDFDPKPSIIIDSGGGYQAFWLLECFKKVTPENIPMYEAYNRGLEQALGGDHCHNIDRLMRLPWTVNLPNKKKREQGRIRVLAQVVEADWDLLHDLDDFIPAIAAGEGGTTNDAGGQYASRSQVAMSIGLRLCREGKTYDEFCDAVRDDPITASWYKDKGVKWNSRELKRIWDKAKDSAAWPDLPHIELHNGEQHRPRMKG
jgi:hypothetical protein